MVQKLGVRGPDEIHLSLVVRKPVFGVSDQVRHKPGCIATEDQHKQSTNATKLTALELSVARFRGLKDSPLCTNVRPEFWCFS